MYSCRHITALNNTALVHGAHATNTSGVRKHIGSRYPKTRHLSPRYLAARKITRLRGNKHVLSSTIRFHLIRNSAHRNDLIISASISISIGECPRCVHHSKRSCIFSPMVIDYRSDIAHFSSLIPHMLVAHAILTSFCNCSSAIRISHEVRIPRQLRESFAATTSRPHRL